MNSDHLDKVKELLKDLKRSEGSNPLMKRAAVVAVVLGFIKTTAAVASDADVGKLVKTLGPDTERSDTARPWGDWSDWKDWRDWSDWNDWNNWSDWNDWKDWNNWNDWNDWKDWNNWNNWRDWMNFYPM
jgi:hypothetical protein